MMLVAVPLPPIAFGGRRIAWRMDVHCPPVERVEAGPGAAVGAPPPATRKTMSDTTLDRLTTLMRDLFDEYDGPVTRETRARDIPQWDSMAHVQLLVMSEQLFGVRFASSEIDGLKSLGDLVDTIDRKTTVAG